jgi:hypothetical protein
VTSRTKLSEGTVLSNIAKATGGIAAILLGIGVPGFVEKVIPARYFGTGYQAEAYFLVFGLMITFWDILRGLMVPLTCPHCLNIAHSAAKCKAGNFPAPCLI